MRQTGLLRLHTGDIPDNTTFKADKIGGIAAEHIVIASLQHLSIGRNPDYRVRQLTGKPGANPCSARNSRRTRNLLGEISLQSEVTQHDRTRHWLVIQRAFSVSFFYKCKPQQPKRRISVYLTS